MEWISHAEDRAWTKKETMGWRVVYAIPSPDKSFTNLQKLSIKIFQLIFTNIVLLQFLNKQQNLFYCGHLYNLYSHHLDSSHFHFAIILLSVFPASTPSVFFSINTNLIT